MQFCIASSRHTDRVAAMDWKREIIGMTQCEAAKANKIDATFFPALTDSEIAEWEMEHAVTLPDQWRSFYLQSDGMEAQKGELLPLLPLKNCVVLPVSCSRDHAMIEFGIGQTHRYYLNLGLSQSVYQVENFGCEEQFFAASLRLYLKAVFAGKA